MSATTMWHRPVADDLLTTLAGSQCHEMHPPTLPLLGSLKPGTTQRHSIKLPGVAVADDESRPVVTITGETPGPTLFVNGGLHGGEYPAIEAVIRLGKTLNPASISGTVILMPVL